MIDEQKLRIEKKIVIYSLDNIDKNNDDIVWRSLKFNMLSLHLHFFSLSIFANILYYFLKIFKKL